MKIRAFITQHKAEKASECQDRFSVNPETKILAVSDGVSQSIFPDYWAELLTEHFTSHGKLTEDDRIFLCSKWNQRVLDYISKEKQEGGNPWRTESNLLEGISAGATLCGVKFTAQGHWICHVIGDSCLVKVCNDEIIEIVSSANKAFDTYPDYLDSNPKRKGRGEFKIVQGKLTKNDKIIIVSDPFSDFFYKLEDKQSSKYIKQLLAVSNHKEFVQLVEDWRSQGMHNDDSTVIIAEYDESDDFELISIDNLDTIIKQEAIPVSERTTPTVTNSEEELPIENNNETLCYNVEEEAKTDVELSNLEQPKESLLNPDQIIQAFLDKYIGKLIENNKLKTYSIIKFVLKNKNNRIKELKNIFHLLLCTYINEIDCKNG